MSVLKVKAKFNKSLQKNQPQPVADVVTNTTNNDTNNTNNSTGNSTNTTTTTATKPTNTMTSAAIALSEKLTQYQATMNEKAAQERLSNSWIDTSLDSTNHNNNYNNNNDNNGLKSAENSKRNKPYIKIVNTPSPRQHSREQYRSSILPQIQSINKYKSPRSLRNKHSPNHKPSSLFSYIERQKHHLDSASMTSLSDSDSSSDLDSDHDSTHHNKTDHNHSHSHKHNTQQNTEQNTIAIRLLSNDSGDVRSPNSGLSIKKSETVLSPRSHEVDDYIRQRLDPRASLVFCKSLTKVISLAHQAIGDDMMCLFVEALQNCPHIVSVDVTDNNLTDRSLGPLLQSVVSFHDLTELHFSNNMVGCGGSILSCTVFGTSNMSIDNTVAETCEY